MNLQVDLLGVRLPEKKKQREKRLGYLPMKELIAEVRKIFPNATVLPNLEMSSEKTRQSEKRKAL
jgi:ABC-type branched-subunit amino acid transport system ATPase component